MITFLGELFGGVKDRIFVLRGGYINRDYGIRFDCDEVESHLDFLKRNRKGALHILLINEGVDDHARREYIDFLYNRGGMFRVS